MLLTLDNSLKAYFQKDVQLTLKNKPFKKGKLINFKLSDCYISLIIHTEKKRETFEIPFPYAIRTENSKIVFDYTFETLAERDVELLINLKTVTKIKNCKFYNTILTITPLN